MISFLNEKLMTMQEYNMNNVKMTYKEEQIE